MIAFAMRLDLFLKASRLVPRRTVAQQLCDAGLVTVNSQIAKSSRAIRQGDEITLRRRNHLLTVRVLALPITRQTSKWDASALYGILSDTVVPEELFD
ncbi:MAG TPA: RNA-binding S4 domain-containing protein [Pyrinomonadaceae bacterium]